MKTSASSNRGAAPAPVNLRAVKAYGDTLDDGAMQFSFCLPVPAGRQAEEAAKILLARLGLEEPLVTAMESMGPGLTMFVAYARCPIAVDYASIDVPLARFPVLDMDGVDALVERELGRPLTVIGACIGTDAHTVGIDAIMNMKGYGGHYGLERYRMFNAINMGAQVPNEVLVARARAEQADALLVSQIVTQKNAHITNMTQLVEMLEAEGLRDGLVLIAGGPRISHQLATELGFDAGFGPGTFAEDVASFVAFEVLRRAGKGPAAEG
ncbi:MAG: OAM dimerization domain-containing protein [Candidatus Sericytochromatia bacterium]|nr:OAM dimerization domain-containing protein [Candidatus Sericytochromatia bacterium]MEB3221455.1 OAM dimerization domain-containing protein [Candidatus Sericytochromatia bacterium]